MCAASLKNQYWKLRKSHGRKRLFATPGLLWDKACEYFKWAEAHPWAQDKAKESNGKVTETVQVELPRPFSLNGFQQYIGASSVWWYKFHGYCEKNNDTDFLEIMERIKLVIETQQFEGACVGVFNPNIIARQLGLTDTKRIDHVSNGKEFNGFNIELCNPGNSEK